MADMRAGTSFSALPFWGVKVSVRSFGDVPPSILHWALDMPTDARTIDLSRGVYIQGWLLFRTLPREAVQVVMGVIGDDTIQRHRFPFNGGRPDVIEKVLGEPVHEHPQLICGFSYQVLTPPAQTFGIGFEFDGAVFWAAEISLVDRADVLLGKDGWLFLSNDTNHSVDQFTGRSRLDEAGVMRWEEYFDACRKLASKYKLRHVLVIAPSKEEVLHDKYPFIRAAETVVDQVCALVGPDDHLVDGGQVLSASEHPELCFKRTDTHWTDRGAMLAVMAVLKVWRGDCTAAEEVFSADVYSTRCYVGDLGVKLSPVQQSPTEFLEGPLPEAGARFDNHLPNIGRVLIYETSGACYDQSLLMFGASSGYPMLKYLKRLFRRVVFVHSAARVDVSLIAHERPDFLLLQSNGRFLIEPPDVNFNTAKAVRLKLAEASPQVCAHVADLIVRGPMTGPGRNMDSLYFAMLAAGRRHGR